MIQQDFALAAPADSLRILIVDDSQETANLVGRALERAGFQVARATTGHEGLRLVERQGLPHLAIVDLKLPDMDGFDVCRRLHALADVPIIILTALRQETLVVEALEQFADDYITKPFRASEMVGRVWRVLRRVGDFGYTRRPTLRAANGLVVDVAACRAVVEGRPVALTPTEAQLLDILMHNAGRFVSVDALFYRLWPRESFGKNRVYVHVSRLRQKIQSRQSPIDYIISRRGAGYSFQEA